MIHAVRSVRICRRCCKATVIKSLSATFQTFLSRCRVRSVPQQFANNSAISVSSTNYPLCKLRSAGSRGIRPHNFIKIANRFIFLSGHFLKLARPIYATSIVLRSFAYSSEIFRTTPPAGRQTGEKSRVFIQNVPCSRLIARLGRRLHDDARQQCRRKHHPPHSHHRPSLSRSNSDGDVIHSGWPTRFDHDRVCPPRM